MEPKFQTSFIPKNSSQETTVPREVEMAPGPREGGGFWSLIANSIFTVSVIGAIAVFGGQWYLARSLASMDSSLSAARSELAPDRIQEINNAYDRINSAKSLLANHVMLSNFMNQLQTMMVKNTRLTQFSFTMLNGTGIHITFSGEAVGYVSVAQQADVFNQQTFFKNPSFYNLDLNQQGSVVFSFKSDLDPSVIMPNTSQSAPAAASANSPQTTQ